MTAASPITRRARGFERLPNELLFQILQSFSTKHVLAFASVSRRFNAVCVRILHGRVSAAATLLNHVLLLEIYPPSVRFTTSKLLCSPIGTSELSDKIIENLPEAARIGHLVNKVYTRFRPGQQEPGGKPPQRHPAGDIPGSRTHPDTAAPSTQSHNEASDLISQELSLDADELFTQLITNVMLVRPGPISGMLFNMVDVCEGTIRVWKDWLAKQTQVTCSTSTTSGDPVRDSSILWVNTANNTVGVKFKVREARSKRDNPDLILPGEELGVSCMLDYEELVLKTSHLVLMVEEILSQRHSLVGREMVFGVFA